MHNILEVKQELEETLANGFNKFLDNPEYEELYAAFDATHKHIEMAFIYNDYENIWFNYVLDSKEYGYFDEDECLFTKAVLCKYLLDRINDYLIKNSPDSLNYDFEIKYDNTDCSKGLFDF